MLSFYRRFSGKTNVPIVVLTVYTEKEYEPFDPYSRFYSAMPISVYFSDTALYTLSKIAVRVIPTLGIEDCFYHAAGNIVL